MSDQDIGALQAWVGRTERAEDMVTLHAVRGMQALFDHEQPLGEGDELPPCWHWMFTNATARQSVLGADGHPQRGGFLPPVPLPRRMWAGSDVAFRAPLRVGERITRVSTIEGVTAKQGSTGSLVFVIVRHEISSPSGGSVVDTQRLVFREAGAGGSVRKDPLPGNAAFRRELAPDEVMLFRFSALTFNGHRIHYDQPYATQVEGYAGLVVHGPLIALALLDCLQRQVTGARLAAFEFTPRRPITLPMRMTACGRREGAGYALWMEADDAVCTTASATLA
jgi:3-methylfumaryl-CoA hydratase